MSHQTKEKSAQVTFWKRGVHGPIPCTAPEAPKGTFTFLAIDHTGTIVKKMPVTPGDLAEYSAAKALLRGYLNVFHPIPTG